MKNGLFLLMLIWLSLMEKEINNWIEESGGKYRLMRQAVHIILKSISIEESLNEMMVMKGGTLLGVKHGSDRYTKDIDFSTEKKLSETPIEQLKAEIKVNKCLILIVLIKFKCQKLHSCSDCLDRI